MKQLKSITRKSLVPFILFFLLYHVNSDGQIVGAVNPSTVLDIHNYSYPCSTDVDVYSVGTINCDMISAGSYNIPFWTVAYTMEDRGTKVVSDPIWGPCFIYTNTPVLHSGIHFEYDNPLVPFPTVLRDMDLPNGWDPDIAISTASVGSGPYSGRSFLVIVAYENNTGVEIATVPVYDLAAGVPNMSIGTLSGGTQLNNPANGRIAKDIHIDLIGETAITAPYNKREQFIATWTEHDMNTNTDYIMAAIGNVLPGSPITTYQVTPNGPGDPQGVSPDIGATGLLNPCGNCAPYKAYITYTDPSNSNALMLSELDLTSSSITLVGHTTLATGHNAIGKPRIESKSLGDVIPGEATWDVVASVDPGSGFYEIHNFNDAAAPTVCTLNANDHHLSPVVSGVGEDMDPVNSGKVGETQFSLAYYSTQTYMGSTNNGDIYANSIDIVGGTMSNTNYYEVNNLDLFQGGSYFNADEIPIAIASSSDDGDNLLTIWYQGYLSPIWGEIHYKFSGNTYAFKPTGTINVHSDNGIGVYPNPATDKLHIGKASGSTYYISDVTGRVINKGFIDKDDYEINIQNLISGLYLIDITKNNLSHKTKFVKQ